MTTDERAELLRDAESLAYTHIRFSGLYRELSGEEWEGLSKRHGKKIAELLNEWTDDEFSRIESEKERVTDAV